MYLKDMTCLVEAYDAIEMIVDAIEMAPPPEMGTIPSIS